MENKRLLNIDELMKYLGVGKNSAKKWGLENHAVVCVGRRVLYDKKVVDEVIDSLVNEE